MPTKNDENYKLMIGDEDGLHEIGFVDDLQSTDEEMPFKLPTESFYTLTFEAKLTYANFKALQRLFWPILNNNWRKMHGIPMVRRKRYRHMGERRKK